MTVSIITINLNNVSGLRKTVDSVVSQSMRNYEWIIIDGGSTDGSRELIQRNGEYASKWISEPDNGIYDAMNKGLKLATGDYIIFLNSGDYFYDSNVLCQFCHMQPKEDVIYGDVVHIDNNGNIIRRIQYPTTINLSFFIAKNICQQTIFYKRTAVEDMEFDTDLRICADYEFNLKLYFKCYSFRRLPVFVAYYNTEGLSFTHEAEGMAEMDECRRRTIPSSLREEIKQLNQFVNCDLGQRTLAVINSNKLARNILRMALYPISYFTSNNK